VNHLTLMTLMTACSSDTELIPEPDVVFSDHLEWRSPEGFEKNGDQASHFDDVKFGFWDVELANGEREDLMVETTPQDEGEVAVGITSTVIWPERWKGQQVHQLLAQGVLDYSLLDGWMGEDPVSFDGGLWHQLCYRNRGGVIMLEPGASITTKPIAANDGQIGIKFKTGQLPDVDLPLLTASKGNEGLGLWLTTEGQLILVGTDGERHLGDGDGLVLGADAEDWNIVSIVLRDDRQGFDLSVYVNGGRWHTTEPLRFESLLGDPEAALVVSNPADSGVRVAVDDIYWVEDAPEVMPTNPVDWEHLESAAFKGVGWIVSADEIQGSQVPRNGELDDGTQYDMAWSLGAFAVEGSARVDVLNGESAEDLSVDPSYCMAY
jgi:hypothetical protein